MKLAKPTLSITAVTITLGLIGCASAPQPTTAEVRQWVAQRYVTPFRNGDVDSWVQVFADGALAMHNTLPPLRGREAIRGFGEMVRDNLDIQRFDVEVVAVTTQGDFIISDGRFVSRMATKDNEPDGPDAVGKFVLIWQRQDNGEWLIVLDMGNQSTRCGFEQCE